MSHPDEPLDDGTLHAYLDGALPAADAARIEARVAASPALQARLARARAMQEEADELLALVELDPPLTAPVAATPSVRGGLAATLRKRFRDLDPIALRWAASFAIIVGGIWLLTPSPSREQLSRGPGVDAEIYRDLRAIGDSAPMSSVPDLAIAEQPSPAAAGTVGAAVAAPGDAPAARAGASFEAKKMRAAETELNSTARGVDASPATPNSAAQAAQPSIATGAEIARGTLGNTAAADVRTENRTLAAAPMAEQAVAASRAAKAAPPAAPPARQALEPTSARAALPRRIDLAGAATLLGGTVRTLGDARLERADVLSDDPPVVRLTYRLPDGAVVLLDQEPLQAADASGRADVRARAADVARRAERSASQVRWNDGAMQLELQGPMSVDSLRRIRAGVQK